MMDDHIPGKKMMRRSFFRSALAAVASVGAGWTILSRLTPASWRPPGRGKVEVRINPLAVPRTRKGKGANG